MMWAEYGLTEDEKRYLNEGRDARRRGDNANPYVSGTIAYYQWSRGWDVQLDLEREGVDD